MNSESEVFNPYKVLNLPENASQKEVKSRFYSFSRAFHPDKQPAELFKDSARQFERIEEAYKILSTPMRKYVFDKYGIEGIRVCNDKAGKLEDLEEEYKETVHHYEDTQYNEDVDDISRLESKAELKLAQEKVRENIEYQHKRLEEEHMSIAFAKEISVSNTIGLGSLVDYYIKKTMHSAQQRERGIPPRIDFSNLYVNHWMLLPEYKGMQHMFGVYGNLVTKVNDPSYGFKYRFRKVIPKLNDAEVVGVVQYGDNNKEVSLNVAKVFSNSIGGAIGAVIGEEGIKSFSGSVNKPFAENMNVYSQGQYDGDADLLTGISRDFKNLDLKLESALQIGSDKVRIGQSLTKTITKKLVLTASLNTYFAPSPVFQASIGFTYKLSSMSKFGFSSNFAPQAISWELKYTRLGFKLRFPITLGTGVSRDLLLISLGVFATLFYGTYLYDRYRKRSAKHLKKLERKHRSRLMDGRRLLNSTIGEISSEVGQKITREMERDGIVVLKAFYGHGSHIKGLYQEEVKKWNYTRCFRANRAVHRLLTDAISENALIVESDMNETVDIRLILQQLVHNSELKFTLEDLENVRGMYNPCLDDDIQPHLMLVVYMNQKVLIKLVQRKSEKVDLSADYDRYIKEVQTESRGSLLAIASTIVS